MQCPKCGNQNPDDAQVCQSCSSLLTNISTMAPSSLAQTSGLAIASLIFGILSFGCALTSIPAIILGIVSLLMINHSGRKLKGNGFAISGIVLAFLLPILMNQVYMYTVQKGRRMSCATNMSQIGMAMLIYNNEYNDFPTPSKWCHLLIKHTNIEPSMFWCKGARGKAKGLCNYAMNKNIEKYGLKSPPDMVLLFEAHPGLNQSGGKEILTTDNHDGKGCNILFIDMHIQFIETEYLKDLKWEPD